MADDGKHILFCATLDGAGGAAPCDAHNLPPAETGRASWLHLNGNHPETKKFLRDALQLTPHIIRTLLAVETRPRYEEMGDGTLIIMRGINHNPGPTPEDLVSIRLWTDGHRIITIGRRKSRAIADLQEKIAQNYGPRRVGDFIAFLLAALGDSIEPSIQDIEDTLESLEQKSLEDPQSTLRHAIAEVRKTAAQFRRHLAPQRDMQSRLSHADRPWISPAERWQLQDSFDRTLRFIEDLDALRMRCEILQDELASALSTQQSKNLYLISVITVIFMPLSFLTGLLGMNVQGIPAASHPWSFWMICGVALFITAAQVLLFRRFKWF